MRTLPAGLTTLLASSNSYLMADLYVMTLTNGAVYRWTSADQDITLGGVTYSAQGPMLSRGKLRWSSGPSTDSLDVTLSGVVTLGGKRTSAMAVNGEFDGATVVISRVISGIGSWASPNLLVASQDFANAAWVPFYDKPAITPCIAPDGSSTGTQFASNDSGPRYESGIIQCLTGPLTGPMTASVWARCPSGSLNVTFGVNQSTAQGFTLTPTWQRLSVTKADGVPMEGGGYRAFVLFEATLTNPAWQVWGAQLEAGSVATPYAPCTSESVFPVPVFTGQVESAQPGSTEVRLKVTTGQVNFASQKAPRAVVQKSCAWTVYDAGCGASKAAHSLACTVHTATTTTLEHLNFDLTHAPGWIEITSGPCSGLNRPIASTTGTVITLGSPLPTVPAVGDTFKIVTGCDKQLATCYTVFANVSRARACPFVPRPAVEAPTFPTSPAIPYTPYEAPVPDFTVISV